MSKILYTLCTFALLTPRHVLAWGRTEEGGKRFTRLMLQPTSQVTLILKIRFLEGVQVHVTCQHRPWWEQKSDPVSNPRFGER